MCDRIGRLEQCRQGSAPRLDLRQQHSLDDGRALDEIRRLTQPPAQGTPEGVINVDEVTDRCQCRLESKQGHTAEPERDNEGVERASLRHRPSAPSPGTDRDTWSRRFIQRNVDYGNGEGKLDRRTCRCHVDTFDKPDNERMERRMRGSPFDAHAVVCLTWQFLPLYTCWCPPRHLASTLKMCGGSDDVRGNAG